LKVPRKARNNRIDLNAAAYNVEKVLTMTLVEALQNVDIELVPGRVYHFEVNGHQIELRVREENKPPREPLDLEADTKLDPWVEFPRAAGTPVRTIVQIAPPPPDIPYIPADEDSP
jgi:hypothetical protein